MADALRKHAVKLNATVARMRVKADAKSLIQLLPVDAQDTYLRALHHPHYARINMVKVANVSSEVLAKLIADGFSQVCSVGHVSSSSRSFFHGSKELVAFSPDCRGKVDEHPLVCSGQLILQVRASNNGIKLSASNASRVRDATMAKNYLPENVCVIYRIILATS